MKYNPALDGIRAVAIVLILVYHSGELFHLGGFIGVDVFFVLSGFLVTSLLSAEFEESKRIDIGRFYVGRAMRLYPNLIIMVSCFLIVSPTLWPEVNSAWEAFLVLFYLADYSVVLVGDPEVLAHTWSLSVEEHYYLVWPLILPVLLRGKNPLRILLVFYVMATVWRFFNQYNMGWVHAYFRFDTRLSGLLLGGMLAISKINISRGFGVVGVVGLPLIAMQDSFSTNSGSTINILAAELCTALMLLSGVRSGPVYVMLSSRPFVVVGKLSYGLYLWHFPVMFWLRDRYDWWVTLLLGVAFSIVVSGIIYRLVDAPIREIRKNMYRVPSSG